MCDEQKISIPAPADLVIEGIEQAAIRLDEMRADPNGADPAGWDETDKMAVALISLLARDPDRMLIKLTEERAAHRRELAAIQAGHERFVAAQAEILDDHRRILGIARTRLAALAERRFVFGRTLKGLLATIDEAPGLIESIEERGVRFAEALIAGNVEP